jgi:hypothetical protein
MSVSNRVALTVLVVLFEMIALVALGGAIGPVDLLLFVVILLGAIVAIWQPFRRS